MKILTTVKKVVDVELNMHVKDGAIVEDGMQYVINAWDGNPGVETSVQLKESHGAETTLVSIGGGDNTDMIRRCYAMGIENGIQIDDPALCKADSSVFAKVLQKVFEKGDYDLVITGKQAQDTDNGQTGIILAEYLGLPCQQRDRHRRRGRERLKCRGRGIPGPKSSSWNCRPSSPWMSASTSRGCPRCAAS